MWRTDWNTSTELLLLASRGSERDSDLTRLSWDQRSSLHHCWSWSCSWWCHEYAVSHSDIKLWRYEQLLLVYDQLCGFLHCGLVAAGRLSPQPGLQFTSLRRRISSGPKCQLAFSCSRHTMLFSRHHIQQDISCLPLCERLDGSCGEILVSRFPDIVLWFINVVSLSFAVWAG